MRDYIILLLVIMCMVEWCIGIYLDGKSKSPRASLHLIKATGFMVLVLLLTK